MWTREDDLDNEIYDYLAGSTIDELEEFYSIIVDNYRPSASDESYFANKIFEKEILLSADFFEAVDNGIVTEDDLENMLDNFPDYDFSYEKGIKVYHSASLERDYDYEKSVDTFIKVYEYYHNKYMDNLRKDFAGTVRKYFSDEIVMKTLEEINYKDFEDFEDFKDYIIKVIINSMNLDDKEEFVKSIGGG